MLPHIVQNSPQLCTFFDTLPLRLSQPQRQHLLHMADALLVCESTKTLAALRREFLDATDPSNMADFLRISPWSAEAVRTVLRAEQLRWALAEAERRGDPKEIYINIDDSLLPKHKQTAHIEGIDWQFDHNESTPRRPRYKKGFCYLECVVRVGRVTVTVDLQLYLRQSTLRRLNRHRPPGERIRFRSKNRIARDMLHALWPLLPEGWNVYVQFDSWYASRSLIKYVLRQGGEVTCALKHNRTLNDLPLDQIAYALRHKRYTRVRVTATDGHRTTYRVREATGRLAQVSHDVRVFISKRHPRQRSSAYFMCTDLTRSAHKALQGYGVRWSCEVLNFFLKTRVGLSDFRVRRLEAVDKYMVVVWLAWAYVERRFETERSAQIRGYGDILRRHRDEHMRASFISALTMMHETGDLEKVVNHFLPAPV